ncbi:hypothetical protein F4802DRAFT_210133 [Xylaria palmicola]|nr:hypothetical protein F4802DRAFT_210133 [Xylaria palmicola]
MEPSGMDFRVHHQPSHHHPHYHQGNGSTSAATARCPALRAAAEQSNRQLPTISPALGSAQYDPVHASNRNVWQSRSPQQWQPAMIPPFTQNLFPREANIQGTYVNPTQPSQPMQLHQPFGSLPPVSNVPNFAEPYSPHIPSLHQMRPTMHPSPGHPFAQPPYNMSEGFASSSSNQSSTNQRPSALMNRTNTNQASMHSAPPFQIAASRSAANLIQTGQTTPYPNENGGPIQQPPFHYLGSLTQQTNPQPPSRQTPEPIPQPAGLGGEDNSRQDSPSPPAPAANVPQQFNTRIPNPVDIRRVSSTAMGRARRSFTRLPAASPDWLGGNGVLVRRGDSDLVEYVETFPHAIADGEGPMSSRFLRGNACGKRVASRKAIASLQSVDIADLPESERSCVICYNDFGVENPEGINEAPLRLPKCKHIFGDHCIKKWFQEADSCPYCRDKVHSEPPPVPTRRAHPGFRFVPSLHITAQHMPGYQRYDPNHSHDRDAMEIEQSLYPGQSRGYNTADHPSSQSSNAGPSSQPLSGNRRLESNNSHNLRIPPWNVAHTRLSPPTEYDRRRRPGRHRGRVTSPPTRLSLFGGPTSNGAPQTSVRPSRSSRSRSPSDPTRTGGDSTSRRSLTNSHEQYHHWNGSASPNLISSERGTVSGSLNGSVLDESNYPFQSQIVAPPDTLYAELGSPIPDTTLANEHAPQISQMRANNDGYSPRPPRSSDFYPLNSLRGVPNQFTSYQQS